MTSKKQSLVVSVRCFVADQYCSTCYAGLLIYIVLQTSIARSLNASYDGVDASLQHCSLHALVNDACFFACAEQKAASLRLTAY